MRTRAFTLVEILVVLGVISLLACLVVPSINIVRARSESATCLSNLRALGIALNSYLADHNMQMPKLAAGRSDRNEDAVVIDNTLDGYVDDIRVFTCPSGRDLAVKSGTSYYWNSALSGQSMNSLGFLWLTDLGKIPILIDKEGWHRHTEDKVNHLFADGHAANDLRMFVE